MPDRLEEFGKVAQPLSRNPLGIIALFIVMVYAFASMVMTFGTNLQGADKTPLIYFLVFFPVLVLMVFAWLVSRHHTKLYGPGDYESDDGFLKARYSTAVSLALASAKTQVDDPEKLDAEDFLDAVPSVSARTKNRHIGTPQILWVDDDPDGLMREREAFESFGIEVTTAESTAEALHKLKKYDYVAIISDMARGDNALEGYDLLDAVRGNGWHMPFFFYTSSRIKEHIEQAKKRGATDQTNRPTELFQMVTKAVL